MAIAITSLRYKGSHFLGHISKVELLGYAHSVNFVRTAEALQITVTGSIETEFPVCLSITLD